MTAAETIAELEDYYGGEISDSKRRVLIRKLVRFRSFELDSIFEKVIETSKVFPKVAHLYEAARELGYLATAIRESRSHTWKPTDCPLCKGEGRLLVSMESFSIDGSLRRKLVAIGPYHEGTKANAIGPGIYDYLFRCPCPAGNAETINQRIGRWKPSDELERKLTEPGKIDDPPKAEELKAVKTLFERGTNESEARRLKRQDPYDDEIPF